MAEPTNRNQNRSCLRVLNPQPESEQELSESSESAIVDSAHHDGTHRTGIRTGVVESYEPADVDSTLNEAEARAEEEREHLNREDEEEKKPSGLVKLGFISFPSFRGKIELINGAPDQGVQWPDFPITQQGLSIKPKMGNALLFWSMRPDATFKLSGTLGYVAPEYLLDGSDGLKNDNSFHPSGSQREIQKESDEAKLRFAAAEFEKSADPELPGHLLLEQYQREFFGEAIDTSLLAIYVDDDAKRLSENLVLNSDTGVASNFLENMKESGHTDNIF
ncbi:uncharacterized protein HKW66_Vig0047240 [Vigna angularis]|uniref:Uncharacterized protein n=1 Tax=Phaseolus angularis TaxID=3914 RepID=A0A8T0L153_PHAAN|nr:uncharacterized protein HKW66_Vig0047240 [Vigna angularis]